MIFKTFLELSKAYSLKELYRNMNKDCSYDEATNLYDDILKAFKTSGIRQFNEFTEILINWRDEILNSYLRPYGDRKLSNSFTENVNGKLRTYLAYLEELVILIALERELSIRFPKMFNIR